ncbi:MAG: serine/threonine-protein kinase [Myxococcota bacterium]
MRRIEDAREIGARHSGVSRTSDALIGATLDGRYRVEALLGEGGMGLVYRVTHVQLQKTLAIKVLRSENIREDEVLARFRREAQSASNIGNEHIVDIHDFGTMPDGSTYFVMECLEGVDLIDAIDKVQRLPEARAVHIARQICVALGAAHRAGIVHRDLKPENVFLTTRRNDEDFVKILDFGIAKVANRPHRLTRDGEVLGTPHYMSPEQCSGDEVDHRTDIYALGVLLYEMVTGHVPHDADSMMAILTKQMYEDPVAPRTRVSSISPELERIILCSLEKRPEQRYGTMEAMEEDLRRLEETPRAGGQDTLTLGPMPPEERKPDSRRTATTWAIAAAAVVLLGVAIGVAALAGREPAPEATAAEPAPTTTTRSEATEGPAPGPTAETPSPTVEQGPVEAEPAPIERSAEPKRRRVRRRAEAPEAPRPENGPILDPWK